MLSRWFPLFLLSFYAAPAAAEIAEYYELDMPTALATDEAWQLYREGVFANAWNNGHYTDTDPDQRGYDFWSDGVYAKFDRDKNGHHETIFLIVDGQLEYVGSIGRPQGGVFVHTAKAHSKWRRRSPRAFLAVHDPDHPALVKLRSKD